MKRYGVSSFVFCVREVRGVAEADSRALNVISEDTGMPERKGKRAAPISVPVPRGSIRRRSARDRDRLVTGRATWKNEKRDGSLPKLLCLRRTAGRSGISRALDGRLRTDSESVSSGRRRPTPTALSIDEMSRSTT